MDNPLSVYRLVLWVCAFELAVSTLEVCVITPEFGPAGVYSWEISEMRFDMRQGARVSALMEWLFNERGIGKLLLMRLAALLVVVVAPIGSPILSAGMGVLVATGLAFSWRRGSRPHGFSASDID